MREDDHSASRVKRSFLQGPRSVAPITRATENKQIGPVATHVLPFPSYEFVAAKRNGYIFRVHIPKRFDSIAVNKALDRVFGKAYSSPDDFRARASARQVLQGLHVFC